MTKLIALESGQGGKSLPRAIAKEKDGIVMYWVEDAQEGGLHLKGLARLLDCDHGNLGKTIKGVYGIDVLQAETVTDGGLQGVYLYTGQSIAKILRHISRSKANQALRDRADDIRDSLAVAGFKLAVMLELAPRQLADMAIANVPEVELLKLRNENLALQNKNIDLQMQLQSRQDTRIAIHGLAAALLLEGKADAVVEVDRPTLEVIDERHNIRFSGQTLPQLKAWIEKRHGIRFKSGAELGRKLEKLGMGHLISQTPRSVLSDFIDEENLDEAIAALIKGDRQRLIGE